VTATAPAGPRIPLVAGIGAGVGASTLAAALHAEDGGLLAQHADIVVCRATPESLRAVAAVACPGTGPRPVLVVTGGPVAGALPGAVPTRFGSVVEVPLVERWAGSRTSAVEAAEALTGPPGALRPYVEALRSVVAALLGSGLLDTATPPMVIRPRPAESWRGLRPPPQPLGRHPAATAPPAGPPRLTLVGSGPEAPRPRHRLPESAPCPPAAEPPTMQVERAPHDIDPGRHRRTEPAPELPRPVTDEPDEDDETIEARNLRAAGSAG
jgi:hypothetical protein